ncbi:protein-disulfide reductase DsbD family protein [Comamonas sp. GB3 AK4-5]|uniref:protein-disulfide reductase DsbD family protein n=1 Tax=Comamonas sp. GB3 AK4-5 TaxID=3231487 RepID=UPI00351DFFC7
MSLPALHFPAFLARLLLSLALLGLPAAHAQIQLKLGNQAATSSAAVETPRVHAELVALAPHGVAPGQPLTLGLRIRHQPGWHTYWKNAGDSGLPTQLDWQLPPGLEAGDIQWPVPQQIRVGTMLNYGYEGQVLLPVPVTVTPDFVPEANGKLRIQLQASWLVCRVECIPEDGRFTLDIPVQGSMAMAAADFAQAAHRAPQVLNGEARFTVLPGGERVRLQVDGLPAAALGKQLAFYPESAETFVHAAELGKDWTQTWRGGSWTAELPLSEMRGDTPTSLPIVLGLPAAGSDVAHAPPAQAWRVVAPVEGQWQAADVATVSPALAAALEANRVAATAVQPADSPDSTAPGANTSLWLAVLGGLLGGLILNLMPCVFPVLAIKLLAFTQPGTTAAARRTGGLAYGAGVIVSFLALGGLLLGLRAAGEQLGWGFQLQSPGVVAALAALFTLIGLNLAGMFELRMLLPSRWASAQARHPVADAFLSGVLAVAIASPCTAPFMGASLGFAVGMPAVQALTVFAALGVGMALPYVLACLIPAVLRWLPRPGAWMDTFRRAMAFPMFATVVWLVWVLGQQSGIDGAAALLGLLLLLAALAWALTLSGRSRWLLAGLVLALTVWLLPSAGRLVLQPVDTVSASTPSGTEAALWQPWSAEQVASLQTAGQPVFVDFTAAWCVTCQFNKKTTLSDQAVLADFAQRNVALLRADWTRRDPAITAELSRLGRSGVPVYVLYAPGKPPQILSELLSISEVRQALAQL